MARIDPLEPPAGAVLLRRVPDRATWLEPARADREARVVKAWRARQPLRRLRDGTRARREARQLARAAELGLPVPALLACGRSDGAWRLEMSVLEGARALDRWLIEDAATAARRDARDGATAAAALVARMQRLGARIGDGHLGNFLIDGAGRVFAVDFGHTRLPLRDGRFSAARARSELARIVGEALEIAPRRLLLAAASAWWRALGPAEHAALGARDAFLERLERDARIDRRWRVRQLHDRWWRRSGHVHLLAEGVLVRRGVDPAIAERLTSLSRSGVATGAREHGGRSAYVAVSAASRAERRALARLWTAAGRLMDHRVPGARPAVMARGTSTVAWLELPEGAEPSSGGAHFPDPIAHELAARRLVLRPPPEPLAPLWREGERWWLLPGDLADA